MPGLEHVALWVTDLEESRAFYEKYFGVIAGPRYSNDRTGFRSYFLEFSAGARLEIMEREDVVAAAREPEHGDSVRRESTGYAHIAISLGSEEAVDELTGILARDGHRCLSGPRRTGDGNYESVVLDPDGNRIELTV